MLPSIERMVNGARKTVAQLAEHASSSDKANISALDAVLVELLLRQDNGFYQRHYIDGMALVERGKRLLPDSANTRLALQFAALDGAETAHQFNAECLDTLSVLLQLLVNEITKFEVQRPSAYKQFLADTVDWETTIYGRYRDYPPVDCQSSDYLTSEKLLVYLQQHLTENPPTAVTNLQVLTGGYSKRTVLFDLTRENGDVDSLVIRAEQPPRFGFWDGDQVKNEFPVLQLVYEAGLVVPKPLWLEEDTSLIGQPFLVSEKASGDNLGTSAGNVATISDNALADIVRNLVAIHNTTIDRNDPRITSSHLAPWAAYQSLAKCTTAWVEHWQDKVSAKNLRASPLTARVLAWLHNNVPECQEAPRLLHGDFGVHNILMEDDRVSAILDWEYLTFGDPAEDIALLYLTLGGAVSKSQIMALYQQFGGMAIDDYRLLYFDVMYAMKFIVPPENALHLFEHNPGADFKLCQFGLQYTVIGASTINEKIALAEQARLSQ